MIRLAVDAGQIEGGAVRLTAKQRHYLSNVMRVGAGDEIEILVSGQALYRARFEGAAAVLTESLALPAEAPVHITLYQALLKGDRFSEVVEKGTEAGIRRFVPVVTNRAIVRDVPDAKLKRWQAIAREAAEQSRRASIPEVAPVSSLRDVTLAPGMVGLCLDPAGEPWPWPSVGEWASAAVVVGPEGGLDEGEARALAERGFQRRSLGPFIFRAENAGVWTAVLLGFVRGHGNFS